MTNIVVTQEIVDFYESQAEDFFDKVFNCDEVPLITDISQLSDFNHFRTPNSLNKSIESDFDAQKQMTPEISKQEEWQLFSKIYNRHWDKWVVEKVKTEYGFDITPNIKMVDLFKLIEKGENDKKQSNKTNLH